MRRNCNKLHIFTVHLYELKDAAALRVFEKKIEHTTLGVVRVGDDYRLSANKELHNLFNDNDIVQRINIHLSDVSRIERDKILIKKIMSFGEEDE